MRILQLADKKEAAMDKLYYFVHQTDATLPKYLNIAEEDCSGLVEMDQTLATLKTMSMTASDKYDNESDNEGSDIDSSDDDSLGGFPARDDDEDIVSATDDDNEEENGGEYESDSAFTSTVIGTTTPKDRCGQVYLFDAVYCRKSILPLSYKCFVVILEHVPFSVSSLRMRTVLPTPLCVFGFAEDQNLFMIMHWSDSFFHQIKQ